MTGKHLPLRSLRICGDSRGLRVNGGRSSKLTGKPCLYTCIDGVISSSYIPPLAFPSVCGSLSDPTAVICSGLNHKSQVKINFTDWIISLPKLQMVLTLWDASGC